MHKDSQVDVVFHKAAISEPADPQLDADDAEYEEDKEAEQQHVTQHGQCVQQQGHQDAHTWEKRRGQGQTAGHTHCTTTHTQQTYLCGLDVCNVRTENETFLISVSATSFHKWYEYLVIY